MRAAFSARGEMYRGFLAVPSQITADAYLIKLAEQLHFGEMENLAAFEFKIGTGLKW